MKDSIMESVGRRIREYREANGMTAAALADQLDVMHSVENAWEHGKFLPSLLNAVKLCSIMRLSLDELCGLSCGVRTHQAALWEPFGTRETRTLDGKVYSESFRCTACGLLREAPVSLSADKDVIHPPFCENCGARMKNSEVEEDVK